MGDDGRWLALHLGDGGIVAQVGQEVRVVSAPMKGEFANQTYFVTDSDAPDNLVLVRGDGPSSDTAARAFALFTDGVESSLINRRTGQVAAAALLQMFGWLRQKPEPQVSDALRSNLEDVFRSKSEDDCTLVLAVMHVAVESAVRDAAGSQTESCSVEAASSSNSAG